MKRNFANISIGKLISWARYLYWADIQRKQYIDYKSEFYEAVGSTAQWNLFAVSSLWLASMWVVIEGWNELKMEDNIIHNLLSQHPKYCALLKRYRNGVYHYQPKLLDKRFNACKTEGPEFIMWVFVLYLEFQRFLFEWPDKLEGTKNQVKELRKMFVEIIGWMPTEIIPAQKRIIQELCNEVLGNIKKLDDETSETAKKLLHIIKVVQKQIMDIPDMPI